MGRRARANLDSTRFSLTLASLASLPTQAREWKGLKSSLLRDQQSPAPMCQEAKHLHSATCRPLHQAKGEARGFLTAPELMPSAEVFQGHKDLDLKLRNVSQQGLW